MDWNKQITLTRQELYDIIASGYKVTPDKRVKNLSSFNTGTYQATKKIIKAANKYFHEDK